MTENTEVKKLSTEEVLEHLREETEKVFWKHKNLCEDARVRLLTILNKAEKGGEN